MKVIVRAVIVVASSSSFGIDSFLASVTLAFLKIKPTLPFDLMQIAVPCAFALASANACNSTVFAIGIGHVNLYFDVRYISVHFSWRFFGNSSSRK